ncbi:MAG TPA: radical SAM protein [Candidatus Limnocylindrales bacterium]
MKVKLILPALLEATDPGFRPIKYALFPPLGLAALAGYLSPNDEAVLEDEHVMPLTLDDAPDLVVMSVYITSAKRAYQIADMYRRRGSHVALGGLHVSSLPDEAAEHADTVFIGPGEDTWPTFLADLRAGAPARRYVSKTRSLTEAPPLRRDLIDRRRYLCPNSIVVSRGCPHHCDFCYKDAFYAGGISFYTQAVDRALAEIDRMPGRHVYFLDDHLLGNPRFATALFEGMRGMGRVFQGASTVDAVLRPGLLELAAEAGMRSVFVGLETINPANLTLHAKRQNVARDYGDAIRRIHGLGIMVNGSFVFGLDDDRPDVFDRTVGWAVSQGIETATFHIMTPYPGTALHDRISAEGRITDTDWDHYDTRHVVYRPRHLTSAELLAGYRRAYRDFYSWSSILRGASAQATAHQRLRHLAYAGGWKKFEPLWDVVIRSRKVSRMLPLLESTLDAYGHARGRGRVRQAPAEPDAPTVSP